jgi:hypothetical protein
MLGIQKHDAERLKKNFGYCQRCYHPEDFPTFQGHFKAVLLHYFDIHNHCEADWCLYKNGTPEDKKCRFRKRESEMYVEMMDIHE